MVQDKLREMAMGRRWGAGETRVEIGAGDRGPDGEGMRHRLWWSLR